jgi:hypothetical protein
MAHPHDADDRANPHNHEDTKDARVPQQADFG